MRAFLALLVWFFALLFCVPALAAEPPKAAPCPAQAAPTVVVVRTQTLAERIIERRMARLADMHARAVERAGRGFVFVRVFAGGCR